MTDTEKAFLRAVLTDSREDAPRLVYADWLSEQGREPRAEFIRLQVELYHRERAPLDEPCRCTRDVSLEAYRQGVYCGPCQRRQAPLTTLRARTSDLLRTYQVEWLRYPDGEGVLDNDLIRAAEDGNSPFWWERGFPASILCTEAQWLFHAKDLCWGPQSTETCGNCDGRGEERFCDAAGDMDDTPCLECGGSLAGGYKEGTGKVPRDVPASALPLVEVRLHGKEPVPEGDFNVGWYEWVPIDGATTGVTANVCAQLCEIMTRRFPGRVAVTPDDTFPAFTTRQEAQLALSAACLEYGLGYLPEWVERPES